MNIMVGRIITLQRQVRELGRLRAGYTLYEEGKRPRPVSSRTWILTSQNRTYIEAAAALWGGEVEQWQPLGNRPKEWRVITQHPVIDAILPPADPISQAYEMWGGGGCMRRCDGEQEQISGNACLCIAQFGADFHEQPVLGPGKRPQRCSINTRLSVFLPDLPDIGIWRIETHGYWPSVHMTGYVETIKGLVGPQAMVPVTLGIEPRKRVANGQTSNYVEIVVALKAATSFGEIVANPQVLAIGGPADNRTIEAAPQAAAIEAAPAATPETVVDWPARIRAAESKEQLDEVGRQIAADPKGSKSQTLRNLWLARAKELYEAQERAAQQAASAEPEAEDDPWADLADEVGAVSWSSEIAKATTVERMQEIWPSIKDDADLRAQWWAKKKTFDGSPATTQPRGEAEPDRDEMWGAILSGAGINGWTTAQTNAWVKEQTGKLPSDLNGWQLRDLRDQLRDGQAVAA